MESFKYLGRKVVTNGSGGLDQEIESAKVKCYMPLVTYAVEAWAWTKTDSGLMAAEIRFLGSTI